jgi:hypothetical protein
MHERRRAAPWRFMAAAAEREHERRELVERQARVDVRAPAVAADEVQVAVGRPDRRPRMAPVGDVLVELARAGGEALVVVGAVEDDARARDEQRPCTRSPPDTSPSASRGAMRMPSAVAWSVARRGPYGAVNGSDGRRRPPAITSPSGRNGSRS